MTSSLRLGTWNCRMALRRKHDAVAELDCSVLVLQECSDVDRALYPDSVFKGPAKKGLAVITANGWSIRNSPDDPNFASMIFVQIRNPDGEHVADLGAIWAVTGAELAYADQFTQILNFMRGRDSSVPILLAGDLNASAQGPSVAPHASNVALAGELGLVSTYHHASAVAHGSERDMTLRWIGPGGTQNCYHCDFIFASRELADRATRVYVGDWPTWIESGRSDHAPVVAEFNLTTSR